MRGIVPRINWTIRFAEVIKSTLPKRKGAKFLAIVFKIIELKTKESCFKRDDRSVSKASVKHSYANLRDKISVLVSSWSHFQIIEGFLKNWWLPGETPISGKTWRTLWDITCRKEKQQQQQNQQTIINKSDWRSQSRFKMRFRLRCLGVTRRLVYSLRTLFTTICFRFCLCWAPGGTLYDDYTSRDEFH